MSCGQLPPELWYEIIKILAYGDASRNSFYAAKYEPFEASLCFNPLSNLDESLKVKFALIRVCRQWRAMALKMLYEDVRIRHGVQALADVLDDGCGKWVRRIELPSSGTTTATQLQTLTLIRIFERCPNLEVLRVVKLPGSFDNVSIEFSAGSLPLSSLKRLDWSSDSYPTQSSGIYSMNDVLRCTPNLQYLLIRGPLAMDELQQGCHLPSLTTLCLRWINSTVIQQIRLLNLPALTQVVALAIPPDFSLWMLWTTFGPQLRIVELGKSHCFDTGDHIISILESCPNLHELNYYIRFTHPPPLTAAHSSLRCIRLHGDTSHMIDHDQWAHLGAHFALFSGPSLPALERVVLYGDWDLVLADDRFIDIHHTLHTRRCTLELPDGSSAML